VSLRDVDFSLEEHADCHLGHGLGAGLLVALDFVDADVVLAILGCCYRCHCGCEVFVEGSNAIESVCSLRLLNRYVE
jgi:hypothetical protein